MAAVDDLLFAQGHELSGLDEVDAFDRAGRAERPTRTTLALVLDLS